MRGNSEKKQTLRTLAKLIKVLDATANPPSTLEECQVWAERWRSIEAAAYADPEEGRNKAQAFVTAQEIKSIVDTRGERGQKPPRARKWVPVPTHRGGCGLRAGLISVNSDKLRILLREETLGEKADGFGSCDLLSCGNALQMQFRKGREGSRKLTRNSNSLSVAAKTFFLSRPEINPGHYHAQLVLPGVLEVDFSEPAEPLRSRRQKVVSRG